MKKIISILLALSMIFQLVCVEVFAENNVQSGYSKGEQACIDMVKSYNSDTLKDAYVVDMFNDGTPVLVIINEEGNDQYIDEIYAYDSSKKEMVSVSAPEFKFGLYKGFEVLTGGTGGYSNHYIAVDKNNKHYLVQSDTSKTGLYNGKEPAPYNAMSDTVSGLEIGYYQGSEYHCIYRYGKYMCKNEEYSYIIESSGFDEKGNSYPLTFASAEEAFNHFGLHRMIESSNSDYYRFPSLGGSDLFKYWGGIKVFVNGNKVQFDQPPVQSKTTGRVLVPIRQIAEAMGDTVKWNDEYRAGLILHNDIGLIVPLNEYTMYKANNQPFTKWGKTKLDEPAQVMNGRTLVPVRQFCESLDCDVQWKEKEKTVYITYENSGNKEKLTDTDIKNINATYYALVNKNTVNPLRTYSQAIASYAESRNIYVDAAAILFNDITAGVKEVVESGFITETNAQKYKRLAIAKLLEKMPDNEPRYSSEVTNAVTDMGSKIYDTAELIAELTDNNSNIALKLMEYTKDAQKGINLTRNELIYLERDYEESLNYLNLLKKYSNSDDVTVSVDNLIYDYTYEFVTALRDTDLTLIDDFIDTVKDDSFKAALGPVYSAAKLGHDISVKIANLDKQIESVYTIYSMPDINLVLDDAFTKSRQNVLTTSEVNDVRDFRQVFEMDKQSKILSYESIIKIARNKNDQDISKLAIDKISKIDYMIWK